MSIVKAIDVTTRFGSRVVHDSISFSVEEGEIFTVIGSSGAGKSTLLHLIGTLDKPDQGEITMDGVSLFSLNDKQLSAFRNQNIGFVFQFHHLLPEFNAVENVALPAMIKGLHKKEAIQKAKELLDFLKLSDRIDHKPSELSGGEQQRVAVARALINNPKLILADEPSGNLDSENARKLHQLFFDLRDRFHQTFIIVTHNEELANLSDRKVIIKDGVVLE